MTHPRKLSVFFWLLLAAVLPQYLSADTSVVLTLASSPFTLGAPVTFNAVVTPASATGRVTFYDGVTVLGTKSLTSGAASFTTALLGAGNHKLKAYYAGDSSNAAAASNVVTQAIGAQASAGFALRPSSTAVTTLLAVADFNGDGKADIALRNGSSLVILLNDGAGNFTTSATTTGLTPVSAAATDLNNDGFTDLVLANTTGNNVSVLLGKGDGTFQTPVTYPLVNTPTAVAIADFNGDGKADIVTADAASGVSVLPGKGDGTFLAAVSYLSNPQLTSGFQASFVVVDDFNGDGLADVAVPNALSSSVSIMLGKGDGTFQTPVIVSTPAQAARLATGDFNGDGKADLATNTGIVMLGKGDGTFQSPVANTTGVTSPLVAVGDVNGDGKLDLVFGDGVVAVLTGNGDGTFQAPVTYQVPASASSLLVGDYSSDGKTDLAVATGNTVSFLMGTTVSITATAGTPQSTTIGTAFPTQLKVLVKESGTPANGVTVTFSVPSSGASAVLSSSTAVTDSTGVATVTATANPVSGSYTVNATTLGVSTSFVLTNLAGAISIITPSPQIAQSALLSAVFSRPLQVTVTDATGAPASGVGVTFTAPASGASAALSATTVTTNVSGIASVTATANTVAGSYSVTARAGSLTTSFALTNLQSIPVTLSTSANPSNVGAALTLTAIISSPSATGRMEFLDGATILGIQKFTGISASLTTSLLSSGTHKLTAYYRDDVNSVAGSSNAIVETIKAVAGGAFISQTPINGTPSNSSVAIADFNGDGFADVAYASPVNATGFVTMLPGQGDGTFGAPLFTQVGPPGGPVAVGDFNGDGKPDLAVLTFTSITGTQGLVRVAIMLGVGDGNFRSAGNFSVGVSVMASSIAVGDFNGDGKADVVVGYAFNSGSSSGLAGLMVLLGAGDGTLGTALPYSTFGPPAVVTDFNGDSKPDLAVGTPTATGNATNTLLGNGDGTAQSPLSFSLGASAPLTSLTFVPGDFNGDGKMDLAAGGVVSGNATTWILLGNGDGTFQPAVSYQAGAAMATGDFDGDGFLDLVLTNASGNSIGILSGKGDGTFQAGPNLTSGVPLAVTDFNGDGRPDLLTGNAANGTMTVVLGAATVSVSLTATGGATQSAPVGNPFAQPLQVTLLNNGIPLSGATVTFSAPSSGATATLSSSTAVTNAAGKASITATANFTSGSYTVTAGYQGQTATFSLSNTTFAFITASAGTPQSATVGAAFANALQVTVKDGLGNPVNGVTVSFTAPTSGASATLSSATANTNSSGVASVTATANTVSGTYNVTATVGSLSATFALTNLAGAAAAVTATGGASQSVLTGTAFPTALQATVKDASGNPVPGVSVTFTVPASGASAALSANSVTTNAAGVASVTATANQVSGSYSVTATAGTFTATFALTNTAVASLTATGGTPQSAILGAAFANALQVTVKDSAGNPAAGIVVTISAPTSGASATLSSPTATTNSSGVASVTATANNVSGSYAVTAASGNLTASFALTNTAGPPAVMTAIGGGQQSALLGGVFPSPLLVLVRDASGNVVSGATVTFSAPTVGASAILSSATALTNTLGIASVTATANNLAGSYLVTATSGTLSATFSLTNLLGGGSNLALGRTATQSSTLPGYPSAGASSAVDGNTDGRFYNGSVTATNQEQNAWWQVDLGASAAIASVTVFNRTDCCGSRLGDFWVFISNAPFLATDTPATLQNRAGTVAIHQTTPPSPSVTLPVNGAQGQFVRVQLSGNDFLSLAEVQVTGTGGSPAPTNLSTGKTATQSSTLPGYPGSGAGSAVDGNTDGSFFSGSVTATNLESTPWWQVDLGASAAVTSVTIFNRTDCCGSRLGDYWVFVSDTPFQATDTPSTLQNRGGTVAIHQSAAPNPSISIPVGAQGRYVRVQLSGINYLSLAEVQVFGTGAPALANLALGRVSTQSSTLPGYPGTAAGSAVDNNSDGVFYDGSVTATNQETSPWWQVDLGASASVSSVTIWNRTDCCGSRLGDYWVFVSDTPFLASDTPATLQNRANTFASHQTSAPSPSVSIPVNMPGRYVRVQLSGTNYLSLAEVQVFGTGGAPAPTNLSAGRTATQSSTLAGFSTDGAGAAVDGNTDGIFYDGSVTATNQETSPWWQVDLGASKAVSTVVVWNRTDCCGSRLGDYWVFVSDTPFLASDTPDTLKNRTGTFASHQTTAPSPSTAVQVGQQGRYVRVQLSGTDYLSLAEVQVFGQ